MGTQDVSKLDAVATPSELNEAPSFERMLVTYLQVIVVEVKNLRWKVSGALITFHPSRSKKRLSAF